MWLQRPMDKVYYNQENKQYGMMDWNVILNPVAMMDKMWWVRIAIRANGSNPMQHLLTPFLLLRVSPSKDCTVTTTPSTTTRNTRKRYTLYLPTGVAYQANTQTRGNSRTSKFFYNKNASLWRIQLAFERQFGDHFISVMNLLENSHYQGDNFYGRRYGVLPLDEIFAGLTRESGSIAKHFRRIPL